MGGQDFLAYITALGEKFGARKLNCPELSESHAQNFESLRDSGLVSWLSGNGPISYEAMCATFHLEEIEITAKSEATRYRIVHTLLANALAALQNASEL